MRFSKAAAGIVAFLGLLFLTAAIDSTLDSGLAEVRKFIQASRGDLGLPVAQKLVKDYPMSAEAHHVLGVCLFRTGKKDESVTEYKKAIALKPAMADAYHDLGVSYLAMGKSREGISALEQCLKIDPKRARVYLLLGQTLHDNAQDVRAIPVLQKAQTLDPKLPEVNYYLAAAYMFTGDFNASLRALEAELRINPNYVLAWAARGTILFRRGDLAGAKASYTRASELDTHLEEPQLGLARIAVREDRAAEAVQRLMKIIAFNDTAPAHFELAQALLKMGKKADADKELATYRRMQADAQSKDRAAKHADGGAAPKVTLRPGTVTALGKSPEGAPAWFVDVAESAGIRFRHVGGNPDKNMIVETVGSGAAFIDYDNDGWLDVLLVGGSSQKSRLYHNNHNGTFTEVTEKAGLAHTGWGMGAAVADYDNDGYDDILLTYFGGAALYHNNGNGTFTDVSEKSGLRAAIAASTSGKGGRLWATSAAWGDYDRDGKLDVFIAVYVDFNPLDFPHPGSKPNCMNYGVATHCGPENYVGGRDMLLHNNGDGTFSDVTDKMGIEPPPYYGGLGALWGDFNGDGWPDLYVANDTTPSALYINQGGKGFVEVGLAAGVAVSEDGHAQAGMGIDAADYMHEGRLSLVKTNFSEDAPNLYRNATTGNNPGNNVTFTDDVFKAGMGEASRLSLGFGVKFLDFDNDGWIDVYTGNGHVFPQIDLMNRGITFRQRNLFFRNLGGGRFEEIGLRAGPGASRLAVTRGLAAGDFNNDGRVDLLVNHMDDTASLLENRTANGNHWITLDLVGVKSNRNALGAVVRLNDQMQEVRANDSYLSSSDRRLHFGLGKKTAISRVEIRWPSGLVQNISAATLAVDGFYKIVEGQAPSKIR